MPIRRVLATFALSIFVLSSPHLAQPHRANPSVPTASTANLLPRLRDLAAAFWARAVGIQVKGGSGLDPDGLTGSSTPGDSTDSGSKLDPNGQT